MATAFFEKDGKITVDDYPDMDCVLLMSYYKFSGVPFDVDKFIDEAIKDREDLVKITPSIVMFEEPIEIIPADNSVCYIKSNYGIGELIFFYHDFSHENRKDLISTRVASYDITTAWKIQKTLEDALFDMNLYLGEVVEEDPMLDGDITHAIDTGSVIDAIEEYKKNIPKIQMIKKYQLN